MKILLVLPANPPYRVTRENPAVPDRNLLRFSILPLTTVAALTPPGHEVRICDENVEPVDLEEDADLVGISFMTALAPRAGALAAEFRRRGRLVVAGGYHPTLCPDETAAHFDAVVVGDAEGLWPQLLRDAAAGRLQSIYRHDGMVALDHQPPPRRELTWKTARHYATTAAVQATRGCPHSCTYCSVTAFHHAKHRCRPVDEVVAEVRALPSRGFIFVDDNLIADPGYAKKLFQALIPLRKHWVSQGSLLIADDPELLALAAAAGCIGLFVGIESGDPANLAAVGKEMNATASLAGRVAAIRRSGIGVIAGIIVGLDHDSPGVFESTRRLLADLRVDAVQVNILTPLPGTPLHAEFAAAGRITDRDYAHYDFRHVVIRPAGMTAGELQDGADWLYAQFYRLDRCLFRFARAVRTLGLKAAWLSLRLGLTYRYDNLREGIVGRNPAATPRRVFWRRRPAVVARDVQAAPGSV